MTWDLEQHADSVKLTVTHEIGKPAAKIIDAVSSGWPVIPSGLKTLLETCQPLAQASKWPKGK